MTLQSQTSGGDLHRVDSINGSLLVARVLMVGRDHHWYIEVNTSKRSESYHTRSSYLKEKVSDSWGMYLVEHRLYASQY